MSSKSILTVVVIACVATTAYFVNNAKADFKKLYWTDNSAHTVNCANIDGSNVQVLIGDISYPFGIAIDSIEQKLYYADVDNNLIVKAALDGSSRIDLLTGLSVSFLHIDEVGRRIYTPNYSAALDGSDITPVASVAVDIDVDPVSSKLYFSRSDRIQRMNMDGSGLESLVTGLDSPWGISLDLMHGKIYWADQSQGKIYRANLDGTELEDVITGEAGWVTDVAVDPTAGRIFWTTFGAGKIRTAALDGTGPSDLITGLDNPLAIALSPIPEPTTLALLGLGGLAWLRRRRNTKVVMILLVVGLLLPTTASAVTIETVDIGNPSNPGEWSGSSYGGEGENRYCGSVSYEYRIGKYEVTAGQYTEFLNAVAADDKYGLYDSRMWTHLYGCKIERSGDAGTYSYDVADDYANRPVTWVSWASAARFANWMHNGQPSGVQGDSTTEDGTYYLGGTNDNTSLLAVTRRTDWLWAIPTEDEWYKAAYHENDGVTDNYYDYPTTSNTVPSYIPNGGSIINPDPGNYATYDNDGTPYGLGSPYYRTEVGEHENSASPYGTFDQGGNVWEWNESIIGTERGLRGGSFYGVDIDDLRASDRSGGGVPTIYTGEVGFRLVSKVPDPSAIGLLLGGVGVLRRSRNRQKEKSK